MKYTNQETVIVIDKISRRGFTHEIGQGFIDISYHEENDVSPSWMTVKDGYGEVRLAIGEDEDIGDVIERSFDQPVEYQLNS